MPVGAADLLRRLVRAPIDAYQRGQVLIKLSKASAEASRDLVLASLSDPELRQSAAAAAEVLAEAGGATGMLAALAHALQAEERPEVVGAILSAMATLGTDAYPHIAAALERADPWERMRLNLQLQGRTVRELADLLVAAGAVDPIDDAALAEATQGSFDIRALLWAGGQRLVPVDIKCEEVPPPHHGLFQQLLAIARPRITVEHLCQWHDDNYRHEPVPGDPAITKVTDLGTTCIVRFVYDGQQHSFCAYPTGRWLDVPSVIAGFDMFMAHIGRDDRCYMFQYDGSYQFFAVAPETTFRPLAERLGIPLETDLDGPRRRGLAYVRKVVHGKTA